MWRCSVLDEQTKERKMNVGRKIYCIWNRIDIYIWANRIYGVRMLLIYYARDKSNWPMFSSIYCLLITASGSFSFTNIRMLYRYLYGSNVRIQTSATDTKRRLHASVSCFYIKSMCEKYRSNLMIFLGQSDWKIHSLKTVQANSATNNIS